MNRTSLVGFGLALLIVGGAFLALQRTGPAQSAGTSEPVTADGADGAVSPASLEGPVVQVWKSPTCGCCTKWIAHLEEAGFAVEAQDAADLAALKARYGIPESVRSCHTALVDGYLVEGHVPAEDLRRLLEERPQVAGLAVPGMPLGSPGMEVGDQKDPYDVLSFTGDGTTAVWSSH